MSAKQFPKIKTHTQTQNVSRNSSRFLHLSSLIILYWLTAHVRIYISTTSDNKKQQENKITNGIWMHLRRRQKHDQPLKWFCQIKRRNKTKKYVKSTANDGEMEEWKRNPFFGCPSTSIQRKYCGHRSVENLLCFSTWMYFLLTKRPVSTFGSKIIREPSMMPLSFNDVPSCNSL